jgi:hypothetical protein
MHAYRGVLMAFGLSWMVLSVAAGGAETPRQYLIEVWLTTTSPDGQERILCAPCLLVLEGQEGDVQIGATLGPPKGVAVKDPLLWGTCCKLKVVRKDGQVFLDATANKSFGKSDADGAEISTTGVRVV